MAKGFGKGFVTGAVGTVVAVAAVYIQEKVIEPEEQKAAFIEEKQQHVAVTHTNHSKSPTGFFVSVSCFTF